MLWRHRDLLDAETDAKLTSMETYFDKLFQLPDEYTSASSSEQLNVQKEWVRQLQGPNQENAINAAAWLGMVRSRPGTRFLENAVSDSKYGGRFLWVAARSLAQIRSKSSIPILIELLDNKQRDAQMYARVGLAEITGVYFGADKRKWQEWAGLPVDPPEANAADAAGTANLTPDEKLQTAREMLRGADKKTDQAQKILLELAQNPTDLKPVPLCYVYVYLGYIQDLAGDRQAATNWFKKATEIEEAQQNGIYGVAEYGLDNPVTRINHLDGQMNNTRTDSVRTVGKALIHKVQPDDPSDPKMNLSDAERLENFDILAEAIDQHYSFFEHKNINWPAITAEYRQKIQTAKTGTEFYRLLWQFVRELQDAHSWLCNFDNVPKLDSFMPPVYTRLIDEKLVVTNVLPNSDAYRNGLRPGVVITGIDGMEIPEKIEKIRPFIKMVSSERCFREEAHRRILWGPKGRPVTLRFVSLDGQVNIVRMERTVSFKKIIAEPDFPINKQEYIWDGIHPSGCGYIRVMSFGGKQQGADEFNKALERMKNTPGLILDVRENPGGFGAGQKQIIGRLLTERAKVNIVYRKNGANHNAFAEQQTHYEPAGTWQYTKPVVLLMDTFTGSASDLFVCSLASTGRAVTMGVTTHGNLSGTSVYVQLPCNLVVRVSSGYICDVNGNIIEKNGNVPMIEADLTIADIINGTDSVIERAVEQLHQYTSTQ